MSKKLDLTGQKFGRLTAIKPTEERKGRFIIWECHCDCGRTTYVSSASLNSGNTKSCGCSRQMQIKDLTGQKFGRLTVIKPTEERTGKYVVWECLCECGNTAYISSRYLSSGNMKSCGCIPQGHIKDITGQKFGRLTAMKPTEERKANYVIWECLCDCGNITYATLKDLLYDNKKSCGCIQNERNLYIKGQKFGMLTAIQPTADYVGKRRIWEWQCDCGQTTFKTIRAVTQSIQKENKPNCGCVEKEEKYIIETL